MGGLQVDHIDGQVSDVVAKLPQGLLGQLGLARPLRAAEAVADGADGCDELRVFFAEL